MVDLAPFNLQIRQHFFGDKECHLSVNLLWALGVQTDVAFVAYSL